MRGIIARVEGGLPDPQQPVAEPRVRGRRVRFWERLGIQSKILVALLIVSILSTLIVGFLGYRSGSDALRASAEDKLITLRESRHREIESLERGLRDLVLSYGFDLTFAEAMREFDAGFDALDDASVSSAQQADIEKYYTDVFVPRLKENVGSVPTETSYLPDSPAQRYLQANYTIKSDDFDTVIQIDDAEDGSAWTRAHRRFQPYLRDTTVRFRFEDMLFLSNDGDVVYSAYKGAELGSNLENGPYAATALARAFREVRAANDTSYVAVTDLEAYRPSYAEPTSFMLTPITSSAGTNIGVLAVEIPLSDFDRIMTSNREWEEEGLGETGEALLVGPDQLLRSNARLLIEDPKRYAAQARRAGIPDAAVDAAVRRESAVLLQPSRTEGVRRALQGETGVTEATDSFGVESITAYAPLDLEGLNWVLVTRQSTAEAYAPTRDFSRIVAISTGAIVLAVCVIGLLLAQLFARPIRRLTAGVRRIASGDYSREIPVTSRDELGDLAEAFNEMSRSLRIKSELVEQQQRENERLLLNFMPESVAKRYREGEGEFAESHPNVTVLYADIEGLDEAGGALGPERAFALRNELIRSLDEAAAAEGVDKVGTSSGGYLASCGLVVPRIDHTRRVLDFARRIVQIVERFNVTHGLELSSRIGIDTGAVTAGIVGQSKFAYDMWGETVNVAYAARFAGSSGVFVTSAVEERFRDAYTFEPAGDVETRSGPQALWRLLAQERVGRA